jgi:hypothetical protein
VLTTSGNVQADGYNVLTVAEPSRVHLAREIKDVDVPMGRIRLARAGESHSQRIEIKMNVVSEEDGVAEEIDEAGQDVLDRSFSSDNVVRYAMNLLDVLGNGHFRINEGLKGGEFPSVNAKAHNADFDQSVHEWEKLSGFGVEDGNREVGAKLLWL